MPSNLAMIIGTLGIITAVGIGIYSFISKRRKER